MHWAIQKCNQSSSKKLFVQAIQLILELPHNRNLFNEKETINNNNNIKKFNQQIKTHY